MTQRITACSRCKQNRPCLSHSFLPFGQCWLEMDSPLLKAYPERRIRELNGSFKRDDTGRYFFNLKGLSFDETPLGYLDWLAGQEWIRPGIFKDRLFAYLRHPVIQKELEDMFPDPDDDSRKPAFIAHLQKDRWHGQIRHREEPEPQADNELAPLRPMAAWEIIADFMNLDLETTCIGDVLEASFWIKRAVKAVQLTDTQLNAIRAKYKGLRAMSRRRQTSVTVFDNFHQPEPTPKERKPMKSVNPPVALSEGQPLVIKKVAKQWPLKRFLKAQKLKQQQKRDEQYQLLVEQLA
jgi:hypothetical protein